MTPLARLCLASGIGLMTLAPALRLPQPGAAQAQTYVVQANDTLSGIAFRFHSSIAQIISANGIPNPDQLLVGQILTIPGPGSAWSSYRAPDGDARFGTSRRPFTAPTLSGSPLRTYATPITAVQNISLTVPATSMQTAYTTASSTGPSYLVVAGDTLSGISARYRVSLSALVAANSINAADVLRIGQRLLIPQGGSTAFTTTASVTAPAATSTPVTALTIPGGTTSALMSATRTQVGALLTSEAQAYGLDPALVKAVAWQESGWQMVMAADGGIGVMQLMPATAAWVGPALLGRTINPYNVQDNIQAGVALLAYYMRQYGGNLQSVIAAYNEGPQNLAHGILPSTAQYVASVLSLRASFSQ